MFYIYRHNKRSAGCNESIYGVTTTDIGITEKSIKSENCGLLNVAGATTTNNVTLVSQEDVLSSSVTTLPRAAPRRVHLMKDPPPPPPPKPLGIRNKQKQPTKQDQICAASFKEERNYSTNIDCSGDYNTAKTKVGININSNDKDQKSSVLVPSNFSTTSKLPIPQYQRIDPTPIEDLDSKEFDCYANTINIATKPTPPVAYINIKNGCNSNGNGNYSSLLCHSKSTTASPLATRKREKLLHRFSDAATLGRKLRRRKQNNRTCRSMTETIEMLADPVVEDEFLVSKIIQSLL